MSDLILGTAQFGAAYGITNAAGRLDDDEVRAVLDVAAGAGIDLLDTSPGYGDAQERLGRLAASSARYVSKFALPDEPAAPDAEGLYERTLRELDRPALEGMIFHRVRDLRDPRADAAWAILRAARAAGRITRIGASVYDAEDLAVAAERFPDLNLLQVPGNVVDRRLLDHPLLAELRDRGVVVHVRSAYLQGLLLAEPAALPSHLGELGPIVASLRADAARQKVPVIVLALAFLRHHPVVDAVLVGAASAAELRGTVEAWRAAESATVDLAAPVLRDELLDPRAWAGLATA